MAATPLPLRSPLPLRPGPRPAPAPTPHWTSGTRGCPGRPRGALTEGGGRAGRPGRRGRGARRGRAEGDGNGGAGAERGCGRKVGGAGGGVWEPGVLGEGRAWAGPSPRCCAPSLGSEPYRAGPTDAGVIGSFPTQKGIATGSEAEVNPLRLCALGILDLGKHRNCSSFSFSLIFP